MSDRKAQHTCKLSIGELNKTVLGMHYIKQQLFCEIKQHGVGAQWRLHCYSM